MDPQEEVSFQDNYMYLRVICFSVVFFGCCYKVHQYMQNQMKQRKLQREGLIDYDDTTKLSENEKKIKIGGYWRLKDLNGKDMTSQKLRGNYYLLYFGFSLCPDVCPLAIMKMNKAVKKISQSSEGREFFKLKQIFVTVNPDYDSPEKLRQYSEMYDKNLIILRAENSKSDYLLDMLSKFKVPVGLSQEEAQKVNEFFQQKQEKEGWLQRIFGGSKKYQATESILNDHSQVFYLMGPDNQFLGFYQTDMDHNELAANVMDDMSYDLGTKYIGTGNRPAKKINKQE
eukprot:403360864